MRAVYLPPWRIDITRREDVSRSVPLGRLARTAAAALDAGDAPRPASLALILSDDSELSELNAEHMGQRGPTDVLSFPMLPPSAFPAHAGQDPAARAGAAREFPRAGRGRLHLGDIIVSVERAAAQAAHQGWTLADELRQLVAHGVLHLCGWDHAQPEEREAMRALERSIMATR